MNGEATSVASEAGTRTRLDVPQFPRQVWVMVAALVLLSLVLALAACSPEPKSLALGEGVELELVRVPAGEFIMGSADDDPMALPEEKPQHTVYLDEYMVGKYEVTVAQYQAFLKATGLEAPEGGLGEGADHPAAYMGWADAVTFCEWASQTTGREVRLCTEAEWEKAARGTDGRKQPWGDEEPTADLCNYKHNVGHTMPVGSYPDGASPYGAMDMAGNVWEYVADPYSKNYYRRSPDRNPRGPESSGYLIVRGGCFWLDVTRVAHRYRLETTRVTRTIGFRVCVSPK